MQDQKMRDQVYFMIWVEKCRRWASLYYIILCWSELITLPLLEFLSAFNYGPELIKSIFQKELKQKKNFNLSWIHVASCLLEFGTGTPVSHSCNHLCTVTQNRNGRDILYNADCHEVSPSLCRRPWYFVVPKTYCGVELVSGRGAYVDVVLIFLYYRWSIPSNRQHLSYNVHLEVRGKIIRTVLCCIVYWSCPQS